MRQVPLGNTNSQIGVIGFGAMHLADRGPRELAPTVLHRALDLGVTLIDTADRYCPDESEKHLNERQIAAALRTYPGTPEVCIATKGGMLRPDGMWVRFGRPEHITRTIRESFEALGGDKPISLWQYHQLDLNYPLEETLAAVSAAVDEGLIRYVGVSNLDVPQIERARQIVDIVSVQSEYSLWCRTVDRNGVLEYCQQHQLTFLAWRPLGGMQRAKRLAQQAPIAELAAEKQVSPVQLALAWLLTRSPCVVPIPGTTRVSSLEECVAASDIVLDAAETRILSDAVAEEPPTLRLGTY